MEIEGAIALVEQLLGTSGLTDLQEQILRRVWVKQKYPDIADALGYDPNYVKDLGAKLWQQLSQALGERVTKSNIQSVLRRHESQYLTIPSPSALDKVPQKIDHPINAADFVGRSTALEEIAPWIHDESSRCIIITGIAGIGKSMLTAKLAEQHQGQFKAVIWQSLQHPKQLPDLIQEIQTKLRVPPQTEQSKWQTDHLIQSLIQYRCLLILDGCESLLTSNNTSEAGLIRDYQQLFQQLCSVKHQSTILLTTREAAPAWLYANDQHIKTYPLSSFSSDTVQRFFAQRGKFLGTPNDWETITEQYGGNPLALQIVARNILDFFAGDLGEFLQEGQVVYQGLSAFLDQQWQTLSSQEQWVLYYLAMRREAVGFKDIKTDLLDVSLQRRLSETIASLVRRSLVQKNGIDFSLQTAISEYVTFQLTHTITGEILSEKFQLINQLPLIKLVSNNHRQNEQKQLILQPILDQLHSQLQNNDRIQEKLRKQLTEQKSLTSSYRPGNLLNLLMQHSPGLPLLDLSSLPLWEVNLSGQFLQQFNLQHCDLSRTEFSHAFSGVTCVAFSPDEQAFVTGHENGLVFLWNHQGRQILRLAGHQGWVWDLCWTPNGQHIITVSEDQSLRVWNASSGECLFAGEDHQQRIWQVVCPSNDIAISSSSDRTLKVWDIQQGSCTLTLTGHHGDVTALALGEPGEVFSGSSDQTVKLWDYRTGELRNSWEHPAGGVWAIAYSSLNRTFYSAGYRGIIACWQIDQSTPTQLQYQTHRIWALSLSACERYLVAGGEGNQLLRWNLNERCVDRVITDYEGRIWAVQYNSAHHQVITASEDNKICLWNIETNQPILTLRSYSNWVCDLAIAPSATEPPSEEPSSEESSSERITTVHKDGHIYTWSPQQQTPLQSIVGHQQSIWSTAYHPAGTHLVSGSEDHTLRIWEIASGNCQIIMRGHHRPIWSVAWSPNGEFIASGSSDRTLKLWNPQTGDCTATLDGHQSRIWSVAIRPDSQQIASGSGDRTVKLWDRHTGDCTQTLTHHDSQILALTYHPIDHQLLAFAGGNGTCLLWQIVSQTYETIKIPVKMIWSIAWSPDGKHLALGGDDGSIYVWSQASQSLTGQIESETGCIWAIAFAADGQKLCSCSQAGTLDIWDIQTKQRLESFQPQRLYEGLNLIDAQGLTEAQRKTLEKLGAKV